MIFRGHYQNGYVTRDLDRAIELLSAHCGIESLSRYDADVIVDTPQGRKPLCMKIAAGWAGGLNIEVMEPVSGHIGPLVSMLPPDQDDLTPRLHHVALRRENLDDMRREITNCGFPLAFGGEPEGMVFAYLDARSTFGHYIELVWKVAGGWEKMGWPEQKPEF